MISAATLSAVGAIIVAFLGFSDLALPSQVILHSFFLPCFLHYSEAEAVSDF